MSSRGPGLSSWMRTAGAAFLRAVRRGDGIELRGATSGTARFAPPDVITDYTLEIPNEGPVGTAIPTWSSAGFQGWLDPDSQAPEATLATYAELRAATQIPNMVVVLGALAAGDGGIGIFVNRGATGSENGSTILVQASTGNRYHRLWDGHTFLLDWFQVGGVNFQGQPYSWENNTGITDGSLQLTNAIQVAGQRGTVVGTPNKVYEFRRSTASFTNWSVHLRNIRIKRMTAVFTTLTVEAAVGATSITVADASGFAKGDVLGLASGGSKHINDASGPISMLVTSVVGNVINFVNSVTRILGTTPFPVGSTVFTRCTLLTPIGTGSKLIEYCEFDGNAAGNAHSYAWHFNESINIEGSEDSATIRNCYFHDTPGENIIAYQGAKVIECRGLNLWGSFVHTSQGFSAIKGNHFENNSIDGVNLSGTASGHSEGCFTWSAGVDALSIIGNTCSNGLRACFGDVNSDDGEFICEGNHFRNFAYIGRIQGNSNFRPRLIAGNTFADCGDLHIRGTSTIRQGRGQARVDFARNKIEGNTRVLVFESADVRIEDTTFNYAPMPIDVVTQITSATTSVTRNTSSGYINTVAQNIAPAGGTVAFTVNNSMVTSAHAVNVGILSGTVATTAATITSITNGSFQVTLTNTHASLAETGTLVLQFLVFNNALFDEASGGIPPPKKAAIAIIASDRITVRDVRIELPKWYCAELENGIFTPVLATVPKKDAAGVNSDFHYGQDMVFENISILFARNGFKCRDELNIHWTDTTCGWRMKNIEVVGPPPSHTPDGTAGCGILIPPGAIARDLTFISLSGTNSAYWPMIFTGVGSVAPISQLRGCTVDGYILQGPSFNGVALGGTFVDRSNYNIVAVNGLVSMPTAWNRDPAKNHVQETLIDATTLPALTAEIPQLYHTICENYTKY